MAFALPDTITTIKGFLLYPNDVTGGWFWAIVLFGWLAVGIFRGMLDQDMNRAMFNAALTTAIFSLIVWTFEGITTFIMVIFVILCGLAIAMTKGQQP
jgi:hypothetical protein